MANSWMEQSLEKGLSSKIVHMISMPGILMPTSGNLGETLPVIKLSGFASAESSFQCNISWRFCSKPSHFYCVPFTIPFLMMVGWLPHKIYDRTSMFYQLTMISFSNSSNEQVLFTFNLKVCDFKFGSCTDSPKQITHLLISF